ETKRIIKQIFNVSNKDELIRLHLELVVRIGSHKNLIESYPVPFETLLITIPKYFYLNSDSIKMNQSNTDLIIVTAQAGDA
ncbi:18054_t:CDS:2, partial [Racocetra persica]